LHLTLAYLILSLKSPKLVQPNCRQDAILSTNSNRFLAALPSLPNLDAKDFLLFHLEATINGRDRKTSPATVDQKAGQAGAYRTSWARSLQKYLQPLRDLVKELPLILR
jgi:hypothetical protein